jgi:hypothetical protein
MRPVALFNDTSGSGHFGCILVMRELRRLLAAHDMMPTWSSAVGRDWQRDRRQIASSAPLAIIINGEGTIHDTATNLRAQSLLDLAAFAQDFLGVPAFLINATLHNIAPRHVGLLRRFDRIYVRESTSADELRALGIDPVVVPDLTLHATFTHDGNERRGVCGTDSVDAPISLSIRETCRRNHWPFWPMSPRRPFSRRAPTFDRFYPSLLRARLGLADSTATFAKYLSAHKLVVTGRFHSVAYALVTRTPFVAVESNTPKISALLRDSTGSARRLVTVEALARLQISRFDAWMPDEIANVDAYCARARDAARAMMAGISDAIPP